MPLHRSSRSIVALLTAVLLLACQVAFAAQACANGARGSAESTAAMPCHDAEGDHGSPRDAAPPAASVCQTNNAVADTVKVPVFALADLPAVAVTYREPVPSAAVARARPPHVVCSSPPLNILHCRLLN